MGQPEKNMPTARADSGDVQAELELDLVLGRFRPRERLIAMLTNNFALCNGRWPTLIRR